MYTSDARLYHPVSTQRVTVSVQATEVVDTPTCVGGSTTIATQKGLFGGDNFVPKSFKQTDKHPL